MWQAEPRQIAVLAPGASWVRDGTTTLERLQGAPEDWLPARVGPGGWRLLVSSHYLRFATLPWSRALENAEDHAGYMSTRWRQLYGESGADWMLSLQPGRFERHSLMVAWPRRLALGLSATGASDLLVQPLVTTAYFANARRLPKDCLFATLEPGCLALAVVRGGQIQDLVTRRVQGDWGAAVSQVHRRLCLQDAALAELGPIRLLALLDDSAGEVAGEGWQRLSTSSLTETFAGIAAAMRPGLGFNLLPPVRRGSRLERLALASAAALLLLALGLRLSSAKGDDAGATQAPLPVAEVAPPLSAKERQRLTREVAAVNREVVSLNLPADSVIAALSPQALKDVALLSIDITNAAEGKARVVGGARSLGGMETYLHQLEQRHDLAQVSLLHHETTTSHDWPYRFTLEAQWQSP